jgi:CheY-like chemotaxis protein
MSSVRILVVEDNALNLRLMRDLLELSGHEVIEAGSVDEGRAQLARLVPDIVLLDIGIPGGGGERLLREIRSDSNLATMPVVAVTAFAMQGDRERFLQLGFDGYLSKPIDTRTFASSIEAVIGKRSE